MLPDRSELVHFTCDLLAIDSIGGTPGEVRVQEHLAQCARDQGWEVHTWPIAIEELTEQPDFPGMEVPRDEALGVLVRIPGTGGGRTLLIDGHTDVVPTGDRRAWDADPFSPRLADVAGQPSIIGRGACDMKAGLAAAWHAMLMVERAGIDLRGDVLIAPVSGEEDGGLGTYALIAEMRRLGIAPDACVVPEPTDLDLVPANAGALTFRLRVPGAAIHASRRTEGVSAIEKFVPLLATLEQLEHERNVTVDPLMQRWPIAYPLSIGTISAGDWASTVPDSLIAEGRLGVALGEDSADARRALEDAIATSCDKDPWLRDHRATVEWWGGQFASGRTDPDAPILDAVQRSAARHTGREPEVYAGPYGSDLRLLTGLAGIPTVQFGPGDTANAHAPNEHVVIEDVVSCAATLADVIVDFCR